MGSPQHASKFTPNWLDPEKQSLESNLKEKDLCF
jgi:hypothetical protein